MRKRERERERGVAQGDIQRKSQGVQEEREFVYVWERWRERRKGDIRCFFS